MAKLILCLLFTSIATAKSLSCNTFSQDYTATTITINRDGAIGFNGTFVTIDSQSDLLASPGADLSEITGRASDKGLQLRSVELPLSPTSACSNPAGSLNQDFSCPSQNIQLTVTGEGYVQNPANPIISERVSRQVTLPAEVQLSAHMSTDESGPTIQLKASIAQPQVGKGTITIEKSARCKIVDP